MPVGKVTATALNLRASPSPNGAVLTVLRQGCALTILAPQNGWLNVSCTQDGVARQGWVNGAFVSQSTQAGTPAISAAATQMIVRFEITDPETYQRSYQHPTWPDGDSGITIGIGYDLGQTTIQKFNADFEGLLDQQTIASLSAVIGLQGTAARDKLSSVENLIVPLTAAMSVFKNRDIPANTSDTINHLPRAADLNGDCLGALVSLVFNRGCSFDYSGDRYREMRAIRDDIAQGNLSDVPSQFISMQRLWIGKPNMGGVVARRQEEADFFKAGLSKMQS